MQKWHRTPRTAGQLGRLLDVGVQPNLGQVGSLGLLSNLGVGFSPEQLFANGEQGFWYDPSDLTTLFQDAAGVTPVTAVEQPVRLMLDKSKGGVGTNGARRLNLLTQTEAFDDSVWAKFQSTISANATAAPNGTTTADRLTEVNSNAAHYVYTNAGISVAAATYTGRVYARANERTRLVAGIWNGTNYNLCQFDLSNGTVVQEAGTGDASIVSVGNGWYLCSVTRTIGATTTYFSFGPYLAQNIPGSLLAGWPSYSGDGTSSVFLWGADLRLAADANVQPTYQPITASWPATFAGNHATASADARRPVLSARVNQFERTESLNNVYWTRLGMTITENTTDTLAPDGTQTAAKAVVSANEREFARATLPFVAGVSFVVSIWAKKGNVATWPFRVLAAGPNIPYGTTFDFDAGTFSGTTAGLTPAATAVGNGWYLLTFTLTAPASTTSISMQLRTFANTTSGVGDEAYFWRPDIRATNDGVGLPVYQRVTTATDYDTTGFPRYLRFDGTDDCLFTGNINFSATDKVTVCAGVRKLSDAAAGLALELSADFGSNVGSFSIRAPRIAAAHYNFGYNATTATGYDATTFAAPITSVLSVGLNASGATLADEVTPRVNGIVPTLTALGSASGTSNFGNYPLYIGARADASLRFNGRIYQLIGRGALSDAVDLANTEAYVNDKTRAF